MHPSIFTLGTPVETYDVLYGIFTYVLGLGLYLSWASLAFIDMAEGKQGRGLLWGIAVLVVPVMCGALRLPTAFPKYGGRLAPKPFKEKYDE
jgi:hypothetical protein